jgi:pimeloyl-ACP methyl ester carboxylesterase
MKESEAAHSTATDVWIDHPLGKIFARIWEPQADAGQSRSKAPFVLLHDSLGCVELWRDFPAQLCAASGRRVIAYDRLGFGRSDPRSDVLTREFIADEALRFFPVLRQQLGFQACIALGHSVGGGMAVHCAAAFPDACLAVITEAAQAFLEDRTVEGIQIAKAQFADPQQIARLQKYHGTKAEWVLHAWTESWLAPAFASWSLDQILPKVHCPVLAIHGDQDEYGSTRHPERIGRLCAGPSQVHILADTHHVPHKERPEAVIQLVTDFSASLN